MKQKLILAVAILVILAFYEVHLLISSSVLLPVFILLIWVLTGINYVQFRKERSLILALLSLFLIIFALKIRDLDVQKMASYLIKKYEMTAQDCVIGHSMGGWIASYMKQECGCKAILLASLMSSILL